MANQMPVEIVLKAVDRLSGPLASIKRKLTNSLSPLRSFENRFSKFPSSRLQQNLDLTRAFGHEFKTLSQSVFQLTRRFATLAIIGGGAIGGLVISTARYGDVLGKTSKRLKVNVEQLQAWHYAADHAGISQNSLNLGLERLNDKIFQALKGPGEARRLFEALGVGLTDTQGRLKDLTKIFPEISRAISQLRPELRPLITANLFGKQGTKLVTLLEQGPDAIKEMGEQARRLGGLLSADFTEQAESFIETWTRFKTILKGLKYQLTYSFFPIVQDGLTQLQTWLVNNRQNLIEGINGFAKQLPQAFGEIRSVLLQLHATLSPLGKGIRWLVDSLGGMKIVIGILAILIGGQLFKVLFSIIRLFGLLGLALRANPILAALGLLITGLAWGIQQLIKHREQLKVAWERFNQVMQRQLSGLVTSLKGLSTFILTPFNQMLAQLKGGWFKIENFIKAIPNRFKTLWQGFNPKIGLTQNLSSLGEMKNAFPIQLAPQAAFATPQATPGADLNDLPWRSLFNRKTGDDERTKADTNKLNMTVRFVNSPTGMQVDSEVPETLDLKTHYGLW